MRRPPIAVRLETAFAAPDLGEATRVAVERVTTPLGIDVPVEVSHHDGARGFALYVDMRRLRPTHADVLRARMRAVGRLLTESEAAAGLADLDAPGLDPKVRVEWCAALVEAVLVMRPGALSTPHATRILATKIVAKLKVDTRWEALVPLIPSVVNEGINPLRATEERVNKDPDSRDAAKELLLSLATPGHESIETYLSSVHPRSIAVSMHGEDLERLLRSDRSAGEKPFALVHARARRERGLSLPGIQLRIGDVRRGWYRVKINHLDELEQPMLPADTGLAFGNGADTYVLPWRQAARLVPTDDAIACSELEYLALEVSETVIRRASSLVERKTLINWCKALNKPALLALAMASDHFSELPWVLRKLLLEGISIRDLDTILERVVDYQAVEIPSDISQFVVSQAFPVVADLPAKDARLLDAVRLGLGKAISTRIGTSGLRVAFLSRTLEAALMNPDKVWRKALVDALVDALAAIDPRDCDAIVTVGELRSLIRTIADEAQSELQVYSFAELSPSLEVTTTQVIELPDHVAVPAPRASRRVVMPPIEGKFGLLLADTNGVPLMLGSVSDRTPPVRAPDPPARRGTIAYDSIAPADSLEEQGWAIVVPKGDDGNKMLEVLDGLIAHRKRVQRASTRVMRIGEGERAYDWIRAELEAIPPAERPRYVMLVGDFHQVSLELQLAIAPLAAVGRLPFAARDELRAYADKVIAAETTYAVAPIRPATFVAGDASAATSLARTHLVAPCAQRIKADPKVQAESVVNVDASLEALLGAGATCDFLLSASHGLGTKMLYAERLQHQGALVIRPGEILTGADVAQRPFVRNGFWFLFACYGLGTPAESSYSPWIDQLYRSSELTREVRETIAAGLIDSTERPFAAALPRLALANPQGPLAVMGHVDLAWSYGFMQDNQSRADRFYAALRIILRTQRAGLALEELQKTFSSVSDQVAEAYAGKARGGQDATMSPRDLARLWMLRQDLRGLVLFGDPAVRIGGRP